MATSQVLGILRGAAQELGSRPGTPRTDTPPPGGAATPPSNAHLLLQISALHKAFMALSSAFMEELNGRQAEQEEQREALQAVRRECGGRVQGAAALQADVQQLAAAHGQQAHSQAVLAQRCSQLEAMVGRLRQQAEEREAEAERAVEQAVAHQLADAQQQWQQRLLPALVERGVQRWAEEALPPLLQPMQEAVAATAELAGQVAAEVAALAGQLQQLAASHENHERRLRRAEEGGMRVAGAADAAALERLQQQVHGLQAAHSQLDEGVQRMLQEQASAAAAAAGKCQRHGEQQHEPAELAAVQQQLVAVAEQQAQQAQTSHQLVSSVTTDVMALARHTKALDREVRSLRQEVQQTQEALLYSCSVFSRALAIASPVGPFTSLPPQI